MDQQELDDDEIAIRAYVLEHRKCTDNQAAMAMQNQGQCYRLTALKKINGPGGLKEREIIIDINRKPGSFSCLIVKEENEFQRISKAISGIEKFLQEPVKSTKIIKARQDKMVESLLLELWNTNRKIKYENDKQILNQRIIDLLLDVKFERFYKYIPRPT